MPACRCGQITGFPWMTKPGWQQTKLHARIECNYQLIIDNLLDLSHLAFVHATTVGTIEFADERQVKTEQTRGRLKISRWTLDVPPAKTYAQFGKYDCNVDRWQISDFRAPGTLIIHNGAAKAGTVRSIPDAANSDGSSSSATPSRRKATV